MGRVMFFLLRMAFWLTLICVLLPSGNGKPTPADANIDAVQAVTLASAAVSDMRGFCGRNPDACVVGGKVASAIGYKAEAGARTIYEFFTAKLNDHPAPLEQTTASIAGNPAARLVSTQGHGNAKGTLTPSDLRPAWHAPVPLPPRREARLGHPSA
jgi:hypothetical protein